MKINTKQVIRILEGVAVDLLNIINDDIAEAKIKYYFENLIEKLEVLNDK